MGLMMVGFMSASFVNVPLTWTLSVGQTSVVFADIFNSIFPGLLGLCLLFFLIKLIKKGVRPVQLVIGILLLGLVGAFIGIF
ncbi:hypothetical protein SDC9_199707 [bioreactor metagenome]|uniref:PTS system mannose-specific EIID component n=1 Tax=bioreactor metagenome TaxID=1076179 RepID=A0A645IL62_9ZZZZ